MAAAGVVVVIVALIHARHRDAGPAGSAGGGRRQGSGPERAQRVVPATVGTRDVPVTLTGLGAVTPTYSVTVRSRVDGQLMRLAFEEGQLVNEGDLLAEIDPRPFQVQLEQAEGQLLRDRALLANARLDLRRYTTLIEQDSVARQTLDTQAALVQQYQGVVKADESAVASAKLNLAYARITSPVSGRVGLRLVDPGNIVHAADTTGIVVVNTLQPITVVFSVPEDRVPELMAKLTSGEKLLTEAFDRTGKSLLASGTLLTVDNQIDPTTGTVRLRASFPNRDFRLFPQQFVNVRLRVTLLRDATIVPTAALQHGVQGTFVYVLEASDTVHRRLVTMGPVDGDDTVVTQGLRPGERVVTEGADKLTDGARVQVQAHATPASPGVGGSGRQGSPPDGGP